MKNADRLNMPLRSNKTLLAAASESKGLESAFIYTLRRINNDRWGISRLSKIAHLLRQIAMPAPKFDQISCVFSKNDRRGAGRTFPFGASKAWTTPLRNTPSAHQVNDQYHQRNHQQQVNQSARDVEAETKKPQN
jgi:hypothetical protein